MEHNCRGCQEEFAMACDEQEKGNHVATCPDFPSSYNLGEKGCYALLIVDQNGKWLIG